MWDMGTMPNKAEIQGPLEKNLQNVEVCWLLHAAFTKAQEETNFLYEDVLGMLAHLETEGRKQNRAKTDLFTIQVIKDILDSVHLFTCRAGDTKFSDPG